MSEWSPDSETPFHQRAAKLSLYGPILAVIFIGSLSYGLRGEKGTWVNLTMLGLGLAAPIVLLGCIVLAIIALTGISRYGREGILVKSLSGILLSSIFLAIWVGGFMSGFEKAVKNRQAASRFLRAADDANEDLKKDLERNGTLAPGSGQTRTAKVKAVLDQASKEMTGDDALIAKAASAYLAKLQTLGSNYANATKGLKNPPVISMRDVTQREQLKARKAVVQKFLDENEKLLAYVSRGEDAFREEMTKLKIPPAKIESALGGYRRTASDRNPIIIKIRATDRRIGSAMLSLLDLLDKNWGHWKYNSEKGKVTFEDTAVLRKYGDYFDDMKDAGDEQTELQTRLVNLPTTASVR